ncbi:cyclodeaminase/cyclohydrolase family protein [Paenibacillus kyungheensis]
MNKEVNTVSWDQSLREVMKQLGEAEPTPGGGSVSAIVAALGAAMTSMTAHFSQGEGYEEVQVEVNQALQDMDKIRSACEHLMNKDMESFGQYIEALRLPHHTDKEKQERKQTLQTMKLQSIDIPLQLMECCLYGLYSASPLIEICNRTVLSDVGISIILFEASAQSLLLTVEINLVTLKDEEQHHYYQQRADSFMQKVTTLKQKCLTQVRQRIASDHA